MRTKLTLLVAFMTGLVSGCENIALMPRATIDAPDAPRSITATVNGIDTRLHEFYLRTANNQHYVVNYTNETRVLDRGREQALSKISSGDEVRVDVRQGTDRRLYADRITLLGAGGTAAAGIHTVQGTVERVLPERGLLELRLVNGDLLTVYVPESSSEATRSRLARVREGDVVSIEGERLGANRMELVAFR
jgi:translation initiation factor IF-1